MGNGGLDARCQMLDAVIPLTGIFLPSLPPAFCSNQLSLSRRAIRGRQCGVSVAVEPEKLLRAVRGIGVGAGGPRDGCESSGDAG